MTRFIRPLSLILGVICLAVCTGCIEIHRVISLNADLSGRTEFRLALNLEPMITMASKEKGAPPTKAEIDEAMSEIAAEMKNKPMQKSEIASKLPPGITVIDAGQEIDGMKAVIRIVLGFDDVRKLPKTVLAEPNAEPGQSGNDLSPFVGLTITQTAQAVTLSVRPLLTSEETKETGAAATATGGVNPLGELGEQIGKLFTEPGGAGDEMAAMLQMFTGSMRESFRLETPFAITSSNATKKDAKSVTWEYDLGALMKMSAAERAKLTMDVTLRRK